MGKGDQGRPHQGGVDKDSERFGRQATPAENYRRHHDGALELRLPRRDLIGGERRTAPQTQKVFPFRFSAATCRLS